MVDSTGSATNTVSEAERLAPAAHTLVVNDKIPDDKVNLRFLMISGQKTDVLMEANDTIISVKRKIFSVWPKEWANETPEAAENLRVLHHGRFLEEPKTLAECKIGPGQTTTVHLLIKPTPQTDDHAAGDHPKAAAERSGLARCCTLL
ncbi:ubiquitin-related domain-containing protein [Phlyctochytrium arcticum]|nr:ubiquitin-related domain-containing protein [Phlyctochytrium arcticum]